MCVRESAREIKGVRQRGERGREREKGGNMYEVARTSTSTRWVRPQRYREARQAHARSHVGPSVGDNHTKRARTRPQRLATRRAAAVCSARQRRLGVQVPRASKFASAHLLAMLTKLTVCGCSLGRLCNLAAQPPWRYSPTATGRVAMAAAMRRDLGGVTLPAG